MIIFRKHLAFIYSNSIFFSSDFTSAASCCAARAKSPWPRSRPIRRAATSRATTQTTQTHPSTPTRRWSWSITCWRSPHRPRRRRNSTWRSATARRRSDPHKILRRPTVQSPFFPHLTRTMATLATPTAVAPLSTKDNSPISHRGWGIKWRLCEGFLFGQPEQVIMFTQPAKKVRDTSTRPLPEAWSAHFPLCGKLHVEFLDNWITKCFFPLQTSFFLPELMWMAQFSQHNQLSTVSHLYSSCTHATNIILLVKVLLNLQKYKL